MSESGAVGALPKWDVTNIYPSLESPEFASATAELEAQLSSLEAYFDEMSIRAVDPAPSTMPEGLVATVEEAIRRLNEMMTLAGTLRAFIFSFVSTDSHNATANGEQSKLERANVRMSNLGVRFRAWIGSMKALVPQIVSQSEVASDHHFALQRAIVDAEHQLPEEQEALAAELTLDGGSAFGKLQGTVTSQLTVPFAKTAGETPTDMPVTAIINMRGDANPEIRERAQAAEIKGWESIRTTVAACINHVKGTALTMSKRRGWDHPLDEALDNNRIDRPTLDAMMGAIEEFFPAFHRYFDAKAKKIGVPKLRWWDLFAPVGESHTVYNWDAARELVVREFSRFTGELGEFAARAFDNNWIDAEPRPGKRAGAFCMPVVGVDESRVLHNYDGSFDSISTLAHELGHAFHNDCQSGLERLRRGSPSTLAETASIFCETLVAEAMLADDSNDAATKLAILEAQVQGASQVCVDISSRFRFESWFFEKRAERELSADEINELMTRSQQETYGDSIEPSSLHPYAWVWKPHYYSWGGNFYNFPYAFGHLFGLGLYAVYQKEGDSFIPRYKELLRDTAQGYAGELAERFGINLRDPEFWRGSLRVIEGQIERYAAL